MTKPAKLEAEGLHYAYEDGPPALRGVSLTLEPASTVALVGQNGSGKTTLAKILSGLLAPDNGPVLLSGENIAPLPPGRLARAIGFVFQNPDHQIFSPTVREELSFSPRNIGCPPKQVEARVSAALERFRLTDYADLPPATLSFGLRCKVTVAATYAMRPPILILDEPTIGLDPSNAHELMTAVLDSPGRAQTVLFVTHDMQAVARYSQRCVLLHNGRVAAGRPTVQILSDESLLRQNRLQAPPVVQLRKRLHRFGLPEGAITLDALARELMVALDASRRWDPPICTLQGTAGCTRSMPG